MSSAERTEHHAAPPGASPAPGASRALRPADAPVSRDEDTRISGDHGGAQVVDPGERPAIAGYLIEEELHRGGQGVVYRAVQLGTKRTVALKVLLEGPFAGETARRRFEREVELAASLRHPNIVAILDSGISYGRYYFVMEYIDGQRLDRYLARTRPTLRATLELLVKVCSAVNFAHQRGVIHRDLKPPNILVDAAGEPHVLDFGLAKPVRQLDADQTTLKMLSSSGQILGTVAYMSPEQAAGGLDVDVRSDVYSLGVLFYEALLGQLPYSVDGPLADVLHRIGRDDPMRPRSARSQSRFGRLINDELETILLKALEKDPARRYQTAGDLGRDLRHLLEGRPIEAKRASGLYMLRKTLRRYKLQTGAAAVVLITLISSIVVFAFLYRDAGRARQLALEARDEAGRRERQARTAFERETRAREEAGLALAAAERATRLTRRALIGQKIQRGDLAQARGDLIEARDSYWDAYLEEPGPATRWALRQYYLRSPDDGSIIPALARVGPAALSPDGTFTAVCDAPDSITITRVATGQVVNWVYTPGPVIRMNVSTNGALAAAGRGWVRMWPAGQSAPAVSLDLPLDRTPEALYPIRDGRGLIMVDGPAAQCLGESGRLLGTARLSGRPESISDYSEPLGELAIVTSAGVELLSIVPDGQLRSRVIWNGKSEPARAVRFSDDELLGVLADRLYVAALVGDSDPEWVPFVAPPPEAELFDLRRGIGVSAFATRDGRLSVYRSGRREEDVRVTLGRIEHLRIQSSEAPLITIDDRGSLTSWVPPERKEQRRELLARPLAAAAVAASGSLAVLVDEQGRAVIHAPGRTPGLVILQGARPALPLFSLTSSGHDAGVSADGRRIVLRERAAVRGFDIHEDMPQQAFRAKWNDRDYPNLVSVALSSDGRRLAYLAQRGVGDRQKVGLWAWEEQQRPARLRGREGPDEVGPPFEFLGAAIRALDFVPRTHRLVVARSNGHVLVLDPEAAPQPGGAALPAATLTPWLDLESAVLSMAFDADGLRLALACEDQAVRIIDVATGELQRRLFFREAIGDLAFNPAGDVLLVRTSDGAVSLFETESGEHIAHWPLPVGPRERPLARWIGQEDALLLAAGGRIYEFQYGQADTLISQTRPYASQRRIAAHLAEGDYPQAWRQAEHLSEQHPALGRTAQVAVLDAALRRPRQQIPGEWVRALQDDVDPATSLRLGHAAFDGERFDLARRWLASGAKQSGGRVDAYTLWRIAQCDYLAEDHAGAAAKLLALLQHPDLRVADRPSVFLQRIAALVLGGQLDAAREQARALSDLSIPPRFAPPVALSQARSIARLLLGHLQESSIEALQDAIFGPMDESSLVFRDDVYFFSGELARRAGDPATALIKYQLCIDLARDRWPSNWARARIAQLATRAEDRGTR